MRETFDRDGWVRVAGVIPPEPLEGMRACARERIAAIELAESAGARRPVRGTELALWEIGRAAPFAPLPAALGRAVDRVFGPDVWAQVDGELGGVAMPNLPGSGARWTANELAWHVDEPTLPGEPRSRVLLGYAFLDVVEPGGGATVIVAGSHRRLAAIADRLAAPVHHTEARDAFAREEPWFAGLLRVDDDWPRRFAEECVSDPITLRAVELTGEAGDIVLLDPRCLHTISANVSSRPRLVMRLTCLPVTS